MNGLSVSLQNSMCIEALGTKVAHGPLAVALERQNRRGRQRRPKYLVNRDAPPPPLGALSCVFPGGLSRKSVGRILDRRNLPIGDERILNVPSDLLELKNSGCKDHKHTCLTLWGEQRHLLYEQAMM